MVVDFILSDFEIKYSMSWFSVVSCVIQVRLLRIRYWTTSTSTMQQTSFSSTYSEPLDPVWANHSLEEKAKLSVSLESSLWLAQFSQKRNETHYPELRRSSSEFRSFFGRIENHVFTFKAFDFCFTITFKLDNKCCTSISKITTILIDQLV